MITRDATKRLLKMIFFAFVALIIIGYAAFASHDFISGPAIIISEPQNGETFREPVIKIKGQVKRILDITLNDRSITIDEQGNFEETVLLNPGYNIFTLGARDKFGRKKEYRLEIIYKVD